MLNVISIIFYCKAKLLQNKRQIKQLFYLPTIVSFFARSTKIGVFDKKTTQKICIFPVCNCALQEKERYSKCKKRNKAKISLSKMLNRLLKHNRHLINQMPTQCLTNALSKEAYSYNANRLALSKARKRVTR